MKISITRSTELHDQFITRKDSSAWKTPKPLALTPAQRLHFDIYGFVLLENVLTPDEVARMKGALHRMKADPDLESKRVYSHGRGEHHILLGNLVEYDPALLEYAAHP